MSAIYSKSATLEHNDKHNSHATLHQHHRSSVPSSATAAKIRHIQALGLKSHNWARSRKRGQHLRPDNCGSVLMTTSDKHDTEISVTIVPNFTAKMHQIKFQAKICSILQLEFWGIRRNRKEEGGKEKRQKSPSRAT